MGNQNGREGSRKTDASDRAAADQDEGSEVLNEGEGTKREVTYDQFLGCLLGQCVGDGTAFESK